MKTAFYIIVCLLLHGIASAQTVPSSCNAPDSVIAKYKLDADYMAHQRMLQTNYIDSVIIPQGWSDTLLRALVAVYNAKTLPARDSVVTMYNIHHLNTDWLTNISLVADEMAGYMVQMKANSFPTGFVPFDDLMNRYHLSLKLYVTNVPQAPANAHALMLESDSTYNMAALADSFDALPNSFAAGPVSFSFHPDSLTISDTLKQDHILLDYRYGWDCGGVNGCNYSRIWHFKVKYTCDSVTFLGSSGDPLPTVSVKDADIMTMQVFPNPTKDVLTITNTKQEPIQYSIYNLQGQNCQSGKTRNNIDVTKLQSGFYFLRLETEDAQTTLRFIKE